jgi:hypothetical protein
MIDLQGFSDPESIKKVVDSMKAAGANVELFMYDGSGHAFMNALTEKGRAKIKGGWDAGCGSLQDASATPLSTLHCIVRVHSETLGFHDDWAGRYCSDIDCCEGVLRQ